MKTPCGCGMLCEGRFPTGIGSSDMHGLSGPNYIGSAQTVVRANGLSTDAIVEGIREGHVYVARDSNVSVKFEAISGSRCSGIGDTLNVESGTQVEVHLTVRGAPGTIAILYSQGVVVKTAPTSGVEGTVIWVTRAGDTQYARAEVREPSGQMVALTNPVRFGGVRCFPVPR